MPIKKKFWIVLAFTLIVWVGAGLYYLKAKKVAIPIPLTAEEEFTPWTSEYSPEQPVKTAEGFYGTFDYQNSQFTLEADDKTYLFTIPKDIKRFIMPGTKFRLKVYYQEKNGKLIFVSAERA